MPAKSQPFELYDDPSQMEPLLPGEHKLGPLLEQAHLLQGAAFRLSGLCQAGALKDLRTLLRAMNSYYTNKIEGQHTLPLEIAQALGGDFSPDADKARRQRLAGLCAEGHARRLDFAAVGDSAIVSGLIFLPLRVYSGRSAPEILATEPDYIAAIGLAKHLSPTRNNGLTALLGLIQSSARAAAAQA